jgi:rhamnosyltransferase
MPVLSVTVIVPTLNAGTKWQQWIDALNQQTYPLQQVLVIDSGSTDGTLTLARARGFTVHGIPGEEFDHGGTRQLAVDMTVPSDILLFLTQDAILAEPDAITKLVSSFEDDRVAAAAYGRQLPHPQTGPIGAHARLYSYPPTSMIKNRDTLLKYGFKTIFLSNSFAAYRRTALTQVGGFPHKTLLGEDTQVAAKLVLHGWSIAYCADAQVYHAHDYSFIQEFRRYFDIGVFHAREAWLEENFGKLAGEGRKFVISELSYLWRRHPTLVPSAILRTGLKFLAYHLGRHEKYIPMILKQHLTMHRKFWLRGARAQTVINKQ